MNTQQQTDRQRLSSTQRQVMSLENKIEELEYQLSKEKFKSTRDKEQTPMYMLQTLESCYKVIKKVSIEGLPYHEQRLKDLEHVIKFLKQ